jgi:maltose O-acetyltransferase
VKRRSLLIRQSNCYDLHIARSGIPISRAEKEVLKKLFSLIARRSLVMRDGAKLKRSSRIDNILGDKTAITVGSRSVIAGHLMTYGHGGRIVIGDDCYVGDHSRIWSMNSITVGDRVLISHGVEIHDGTAHSQDAQERHEHFRLILTDGHPTNELPGVYSEAIVIEDDVWISFGATIFKGVRIGKGSIIGANAIVTRDVPADSLYYCKVQPVVRKITRNIQADKIQP